MCYKGILTDEVKALSIELFMNAFDMTEEQATAYYDAVIEHDKDEMTKLMIKAGIPREEAKQITAEIAAYGYENFLIMLYEENTGTETTLEYEFIENRYIGKLCKDITNPTEDTNPECYDYKNESTLISFLEEYMDLSNAQAVDFYKSVKSHDKERIFLFFLTILNASPGVSINIATEFEKNGYEEYIVLTYEQQTGNIFDKAKIYNETNVAQISYLKDNQVKIYLEDYQGNVILEPTLISEISYDYVLHKKVSTHSPENEEYKNKYKLRVWIDEETDSSDWNETTDLNYEFKIGVESRPPSYEVKYDANGGTSGLTTISEGAYAWTNENGVWKSNNTDEYGTESTLTTEEF